MIQALKEAILLTAGYYGRQISDPVLAMYVEDLQDLNVGKVIRAYADWRRNPRNTAFPLPAQIRGMVEPQVDPLHAAQEIAARITHAITKFGHPCGQEAREYIGPIGWAIVNRQGGWGHLCKYHGITIQPTAFQAQARDLAVSMLKYPVSAMNEAIGLPPGLQEFGFFPIKEIP